MSDILKSLLYFIPGIIAVALMAKYLWKPFVSSTSNKVRVLGPPALSAFMR